MKKKKFEVIKNRKTDKDYVSGPMMLEELIKWYKTDDEEVPKILVSAVSQICYRLGSKHNFAGYSYIDEMKGNAIEKCIIALVKRKFNPEKSSNPFAYFTQIAYNEMVGVINNEKKQTYIKHKSMEKMVVMASMNGDKIEYDDDGSGRIEKLVELFEPIRGLDKDEEL